MYSAESERIIDFDEEFAECFSEANDLIPGALSNTSFPVTVRSLLGLMASSDSLKLAVIDLAESPNFYSASVVYRSLLEHYLRFQYLWLRVVEEKADDPGKEYEQVSNILGQIEWAESVVLMSKLDGREVDADPITLLIEQKLIDPSITKNKLKKARTKWSHRNIVRYLTTRIRKEGSDSGFILAKIIPIYSELSAFVHGAPDAESKTAKLMSEGVDEKEAWELAKWSCILANSMKCQFLLCLGMEQKNLLKVFNSANGKIGEFLNAGT